MDEELIPKGMEKAMKALVIGVDGASWNVVEKLRGLEVLSKRFIERNTAYGVLESTIPPWSIPAWNSLFTEIKPEKMKLYSFIKRRGKVLAPVIRELNDQVYIWDLVSMCNGKVVAVNVPCVSKAVPVKGYFVAGFLANRSELAFPTKLNEVLRRYGYIVDVTDVHPLTDEEYLETCIKATIQETVLFLQLSKSVDWSLGIIVYTHSDRIQHRFLKTRFSFVEKYYEVLDASIAKLLDAVDTSDTIAFIVSDHGFKIPKAAFSVNTWLASRGYLSVKPTPIKTRIAKVVRYTLSNSYIPLTITRKIAKKLPRISRRRTEQRASEAPIGDKAPKGAYMPSEDGTIYIMSVTDKIRRVLADKIAEEIGEHIPEIKVHKAVEAYNVVSDEAPNLVLESDSLAFSTDPVLPLKLRTMRATHAREGVFMVLGPQQIISPGFKGRAKVYDVAPTVLYTLGIPIPSYMDGCILTKLFTENLVKRHERVYTRITYEKATIRARIQRLKLRKTVR
jgi:predicted AlkP superfamily phosphohydrolase/phosphomutase